ncbi:DUF4838 domain-containing protein [Jiangella gansuensis]|uniref:DUF4838 domain-containing protein n=1 Tax=Jiangella gansuensis TaxID=281473 RepID=UPI00146FC26F|nr:DUF4838 domain-containing protein [Jiangella gansuensis]
MNTSRHDGADISHPVGAINAPVARRTFLQAAAAAGVGGAFLGLPAVAHANPHARRLFLARRLQTTYAIVVGQDEGAVVVNAANELADYLGQMGGVTFPVFATDDLTNGQLPPGYTSKIVVGRLNEWATDSDLVDDDPLPLEDAERDGFSFRSVDGDVLIAGVSPRGTLYGVYYLLDHVLGVRWFAPDTTLVPQRPVVTLLESTVNADHFPRFDYREVFISDGVSQYEWRHRNLMNGRRGYLSRDAAVPPPAELDTWSYIWPGINPGQFKEIITDQTMWHSNQVKFMDPAVRDFAVTSLAMKITQRITANGDYGHPFHMNDGAYDNPDAASEAFAQAHGDTLAAPALDMVNEVAQRLEAQIPGARLETQAYLWGFKPPTGMTVADNVTITTAPIPQADLGTNMFQGRNAQIGADIDGWRAIASSIVMWDYHYATMDFLVPFADWWAHPETIKELADRSDVVGYFGEGQFRDGSSGIQLKALKAWVCGRLLWDPDADIDDLIEEFCTAYFGSGAPYILQALQLLDQARTTFDYSLHISRVTAGSRYLNWQVLRQCDQLMDQAAAATTSEPLAAEHVLTTRMMIDHPILMRHAQLAQDAMDAGVTWNIDYNGRLARLQSAVAAAGLTTWNNYDVSMQSLYDAYAIARTPSQLPPACVGLPESDFHILEDYAMWKYPSMTTPVFDSQANDHAAVRLLGSVETWGVQLALSELPSDGTWRIHFTVRADLTSGADPTKVALVLGIYPELDSPAVSEWGFPVSAFSDGQYHEFEVPRDFSHDRSGQYIYVTGRNTQVPYLYIDRIYLTRASA